MRLFLCYFGNGIEGTNGYLCWPACGYFCAPAAMALSAQMVASAGPSDNSSLNDLLAHTRKPQCVSSTRHGGASTRRVVTFLCSCGNSIERSNGYLCWPVRCGCLELTHSSDSVSKSTAASLACAYLDIESTKDASLCVRGDRVPSKPLRLSIEDSADVRLEGFLVADSPVCPVTPRFVACGVLYSVSNWHGCLAHTRSSDSC